VVDKHVRRTATDRPPDEDRRRQKLDLDDVRAPPGARVREKSGESWAREFAGPHGDSAQYTGVHGEPSQPSARTGWVRGCHRFDECTRLDEGCIGDRPWWIGDVQKADVVALCDGLGDARNGARASVSPFELRSERRDDQHAEPMGCRAHMQIQSEGSRRRVTLRTADSIRLRGRR